MTAEGVGPLQYQWRHYGTALPGATGNSLTLSAVTPTDAGFYDVVVTDGTGPIASQAGSLAVTPAAGYPGKGTLRLDGRFSPKPEVSGTVNSVALLADGRCYLAGEFTRLGSSPRAYVARLLADGSIDPDFNPIVGSWVGSVVVQGDGKVLIGGAFRSIGSVPATGIARLNPDGTLDSEFYAGTALDNGVVYALAVQPDGKILLGGSFSSYRGVSRSGILRLNSDGTLDTTFDPGAGLTGEVYTLTVGANGEIFVGGRFATYAGAACGNFVKLKANGSRDTSFSVGTGFTGNGVYSIAVQGDGKVLVGGGFTTCNGVACGGIVRLETDGSLDLGFQTGTGFNGSVRKVLMCEDGAIMASGDFSSYNGSNRAFQMKL